MIENLPFTVGDASEDRYRDDPVGEYDKLPAELATEELLMVASGRPLPASARDIQSLRFPPARPSVGANCTSRGKEISR